MSLSVFEGEKQSFFKISVKLPFRLSGLEIQLLLEKNDQEAVLKTENVFFYSTMSDAVAR